MKQTEISTLTYKDQDFDVLVHKGKVSYIFEIGDKRYGNAVTLKGKKTKDTVVSVFALLVNLIETYDAAAKR